MAARWRRETRDIEKVLDRERHAGEGPECCAAGPRIVVRASGGAGSICENCGEGIEHRVVGGDADECGPITSLAVALLSRTLSTIDTAEGTDRRALAA